jgi:hypothetical protein
MVLGEQLGGWILAKKVNITQAASACLTAKHWDSQAATKPMPEAQPPAN